MEITLILLLIISAVMAGSETALFTIAHNPNLLQKERNRSQGGSVILKLLEQPSRLLMTVLLSNLLVNLLFFAFSSLYVLSLEKEDMPTAALLVSLLFSLAVILGGEIIPKLMASTAPLLFARVGVVMLFPLSKVLMPLTTIMDYSVRGFNRLLGIDREKPTMDHDLVTEVLKVSGEEGVLPAYSTEIMTNVIGLHRVRLKEIMTPRVDVKALPVTSRVADVLEEGRKYGYHTVPLHGRDHEDIESYVELIDLLQEPPNTVVSKFAKPVHFMPELASMDWVLREIIENEIKNVLVVDEYGMMAGWVSWYDVMSYLHREVDFVKRKDPVEPYHILSGRAMIRDLGLIDEKEETGEHVTLAGYLSSELGRVPKSGEEVWVGSHRFLILEATERHIRRVAQFKEQA